MFLIAYIIIILFIMYIDKIERIFRPVYTEYPLIRIGQEGDGGYLIVNNKFNTSLILGYGVNDDASFENQLTEHFGIDAYVFDHTIDKPPEMGPRVKYIKEGISDRDEKDVKSLKYHMDKYLKNDGSFCILKMDVEGAEWKSLKNADLSRVSQIILEMHDMGTEADFDLIKKINTDFYLISIHGNNYGGYCSSRGKKFPKVIECTWVRKEFIHNPVYYDGVHEMNMPCNANEPELEFELI